LARSYDEAHGTYGQAHTANFGLQWINAYFSVACSPAAIVGGRVYGNGFMVCMVLMENHGENDG
jgi:hypothetical protein